MPESLPEPAGPTPTDLHRRLDADIAAGRTVVLSRRELQVPAIRAQLPQLLDAVTRGNPRAGPLVLPGYTVLAEIGRGGMSTVYLAWQDSLARHVALKVTPRAQLGDERSQQRLLQEARAMARTSHPNIVKIHDVVVAGDSIAIAMEWIDGLTLADLLRLLPPRPEDDDTQRIAAALGTQPDAAARFDRSALRLFVRMVHDVACAVQHVHDRGLLHLDIKPSNVLVRRDGTPLLADFGVVREIDAAATHTQTFAGTLVYAAPEQLRRDDAAIGPQTDVYALGMTLYELLARQQPLRELGPTQFLPTIEGGRIPPLATLTTVAPDLANIVHKALAPERPHRYRTAAEFADDLLAFLEHRPVQARPLTRWQQLARWARTQPWKAALAASLLLFVPTVVLMGGYLLSQLPRLVAAEREDRRRAASELRQQAFFDYFFHQIDRQSATSRLQRAIELDPTDATIACLLTMAHEEQHPKLPALLAEHAAAIARQPGLRLLAQKIAAQRAFFLPTEVEALTDSREPIAHFVLALDRTLWAEDQGDDDAKSVAIAALDRATIAWEHDALLNCLRLWLTAMTRDAAAFERLARALEARWPDSQATARWIAACEEPVDLARMMQRLESLVAANPGATWAWEQLASAPMRRSPPDPAQTLATVARAKAQGQWSARLLQIELHAEARLKGAEGARRALAEIPPELLDLHDRLSLLAALDPAAAKAASEAVLATRPVRWCDLRSVHEFAIGQDDMELARRAYDVGRQEIPDRRGLAYRQLPVSALALRDFPHAAAIARDYRLSRGQLEVAPILTTVFGQVRDWQNLLDTGLRWHELAPPESQAQPLAHAGLAAARLGRPVEAARHLAAALHGAAPLGKWYAYALVEDAWLRVGPGLPAELRDPALAAARIATLDRINPTLKTALVGPWTDLVRAEVQFANGNIDGARTTLARAARYRHTEPHAPDEVRDWIKAAAARYEQ